MAHQSDNTTNTHSTARRPTLPPLHSTLTASSSSSSLTLPSLFSSRPILTAPQYDLAHFASVFATFSQKAAQDIHTEKMELGGNSPGSSYAGYGRQLGETDDLNNNTPAYPAHYMPSDNSGRSGQFPPGHPMTSQYGGQSSYPAFHSAAGGSTSHQQAQYTSVPTADLAALQMMWLQTMGSGRGHPQPASEPTQSSYQLSSQPSAPWPIPTMPGQPIPGGAMGNNWLPPNVPGSAVPPFAVPHAGGNQIHPNLGQQVSEMQARQLLYMQWQQQQQQLAAGGGSSSAGFDPAAGSPPGDRSSGSEAHGTEDPDITDDKRRRNTEASARFRAKKKERVNALSSKISNLENKANDLEREATDLKTENAWLKELVIMKGRRRLEVQGAASTGSRAQHEGDSDSEHE
ncbi:hypothetical protein FRC04_006479 [Tulasnella sp. 424]|nr:hypothetical protein FRC04_006479 [Tulasnella sp. 424]KAG8980525.1 hypothetical protein FRC05_006158 [Tulasnella sp. 425]